MYVYVYVCEKDRKGESSGEYSDAPRMNMHDKRDRVSLERD